MRYLFEGGYYSRAVTIRGRLQLLYICMWRYAYAGIIDRLLFSVSMASQVDEVLYFDSIMHGHHIYVQDSVVSVYSRAATILLHSSPSVASTVWSPQQAGEIVRHIPSKLSQMVNLQRKRA